MPQSQEAQTMEHSPQLQEGSSSQRTQRVFACVHCYQHKLKCDLNSPCSSCVQREIACEPSLRAPARKKRGPYRKSRERLARRKAPRPRQPNASTSGPLPAKAVALAAGHKSLLPRAQADTMSGAASTASPPAFSLKDTPANSLPAGNLVVEDGSVTFTDSYRRGIVQDNLPQMRDVLESESRGEQSLRPPYTVAPDHNVHQLLLNHFPAIDPQTFVPAPSAAQIYLLWKVFLERVNPVTKLVHVPTLEPWISKAMTNPNNLNYNAKALLFSIYLVSVVSLTQAETEQMLGMTKDEALKLFTAGVKTSLIRADFMRRYDMATLQTLLLYLISLQGRHDGRGAWITTHLLIRIAYNLGLHRDGETLNLRPLKTEIRRRLWWHIIMLDIKYAITSGFKDTLLLEDWDTKMPSNVDDADLLPGAPKPLPRKGATEMVFVLMLYHAGMLFTDHSIADFERVLLSCQRTEPGSPRYASVGKSVFRLHGVLKDIDARLMEIEKRFCDTSAGPIHVAAAHIRPFIMQKVHLMVIPMCELGGCGTQQINTSQDNMFRIALSHHESTLRLYKNLQTDGIMWFLKCHFQVDSFFFLVGQLCHRQPSHQQPSDQQAARLVADRAWFVIDSMYEYHEELWDMSRKEMVQIGSLVMKAWRLRAHDLEQSEGPCRVPACVSKLMNSLPQSILESSGQLSSPPLGMRLVPPILGLGNPPFDLMHGLMETSGMDLR
ncbi:hypothetical protein ACHAQA_007672 [Verticillium albo-atrum]